jgi:hypothetical protein
MRTPKFAHAKYYYVLLSTSSLSQPFDKEGIYMWNMTKTLAQHTKV